MNETSNYVIEIATALQAVAAIAMILVAISAGNTAREQKDYAKMQINLSLYEKRYKIYKSMMVLINTILNIPLPNSSGDLKEFIDKGSDALKTYWTDSKEKSFLIDKEMINYMDLVEQKVKGFINKVAQNPPSSEDKMGSWLSEIQQEKMQLLTTYEIVHQRFKIYLDFRKI